MGIPPWRPEVHQTAPPRPEPWIGEPRPTQLSRVTRRTRLGLISLAAALTVAFVILLLL